MLMLNLQQFATAPTLSDAAANAKKKFSEFGGQSTVVARIMAEKAGEPQNYRNYMNGGVSNKPVATMAPTASFNTPAPMATTAANTGNKMGIGSFESSQFPGAAASPSNGQANAQNYINELAAAQKNAAISALGKSRDNALSNLNAEKSAIAPKYQDARNQASAGAQQQARNFAEYMANRGGASSGASAQAQISNNTALQGSLGTLGTQETAAYTDIGRRTSDVGNAYESDVASATAGAEAEKMKLLLTDYYDAQRRGDTLAQNALQNKIADAQLQLQQAQLRLQERGQDLTQSNFDRGFNRGIVESDRSFDETKGQNKFSNELALGNQRINEGQLTGNYTDSNTAAVQQKIAGNSAAWFNASPEERTRLAAENQQLGASIGAKQNENGDWVMPQSQRTVPGQQLDLAKSGQDFSQGMAVKQFDAQEAQRSWDNEFKTGQFDLQKASTLWEQTFKDKSFEQSVKQFAQNLGADYAKMNQSQQQFTAEMAFKEKAQQLQRDQFDFDKTKGTPNAALNKELDGLYSGLTSGQLTSEAAINEINGRVKAGLTTPQDAAQMLALVQSIRQPTGTPPLNQDQIDRNGGNNPQDLNMKQSEQLWKTDPTGQKSGVPMLDWAQWNRDPRGRMGGVSYKDWAYANGPQLK